MEKQVETNMWMGHQQETRGKKPEVLIFSRWGVLKENAKD